MILKDAQQLDLHGGRNISGLVDEQRPLMRHFGQTYFLPDGPGERAFFVAEEFALEQAVGDAGRVHRDKGAGPAAAIVDVMGQQFLAHAGFPEDQHRGVGRAYLAAVRQQAAHDGTAVQQDFRRIPVGLGLRLFLFPGGKAGRFRLSGFDFSEFGLKQQGKRRLIGVGDAAQRFQRILAFQPQYPSGLGRLQRKAQEHMPLLVQEQGLVLLHCVDL